MDETTIFQDFSRTGGTGGQRLTALDAQVLARYSRLVQERKLTWTAHYHFSRMLGFGGQGVVFLTERQGADGFNLPTAVKIFSPEAFVKAADYDEAMLRVATVSSRVAQIQQDNLLDVHDFIDRDRIRLMFMEWIDGYDLKRLMTPEMMTQLQHNATPDRWEYLNNVVVTHGPTRPRLKPGIAVAIVRECLAALAALHRAGIVHGDIKPSNIMLKRTGNAKIIDIGSAFAMDSPPAVQTCTPPYAAPEVLDQQPATPQSDLASLGYVLLELLAGRSLLPDVKELPELIEAKRNLPRRLHEILPHEVLCNDLLMGFCLRLIAADPQTRFQSAEAAALHEAGAAAFQRQLVFSNLSSEYDHEIQLWFGYLHGFDVVGP